MNEVKRGQFLKELRKSSNLTQQELGELLHYSNKAISKWEQGLSFPNNPTTLQKLAELYNISVLEILYGERKTKQNEEQIDKNASAIYKRNYKKLSFFIIITILLTSLVLFLGIFSFYSYFIKGSIRNYTFQGEGEHFHVNKSSILLTNGQSFLNFAGVKGKEEDKINEIKLYYYDQDASQEVLVFGGSNDSYYFSIPKGYNEINLKKLIKSNLYIEIRYNNTEYEKIDLPILEDYKNDKLFYKKKEIISNETDNHKENKSFIEFLKEEGFTYEEDKLTKKENNVVITFQENIGFIVNNENERFTCSMLGKNAIYTKIAGEHSITEIIPLEENLSNEETFKNTYLKYLNYLFKKYNQTKDN